MSTTTTITPTAATTGANTTVTALLNDVVYWMYDDPEAGHVFSVFMRNHWEIPIYISIIYVVTVFGIKRFMRDREPFSLRLPLILWNAFLAAFSIAGFCFTSAAMYRVVSRYGFRTDLCGPDSESANPWVLLFCLSKIPEFLDTIFIVLRKRPLIFLHWYHHILTMMYCWDAWATRVMSGGWFACMNLGVHSIMYSYYALAAYGVRFPRLLRQSITSLQIIQMVGGMVITLLALDWCTEFPARHRLNLWAALAMYISYAILFVQFFISAYFGSPSSAAGSEAGPSLRKKPSSSTTDVGKKSDGKTPPAKPRVLSPSEKMALRKAQQSKQD